VLWSNVRAAVHKYRSFHKFWTLGCRFRCLRHRLVRPTGSRPPRLFLERLDCKSSEKILVIFGYQMSA
jgi:hypothetical protein